MFKVNLCSIGMFLSFAFRCIYQFLGLVITYIIIWCALQYLGLTEIIVFYEEMLPIFCVIHIVLDCFTQLRRPNEIYLRMEGEKEK